MIVSEEIKTNLIQFNKEIAKDHIAVRAFYLDKDEELEGTVAHVIFVVDKGEVPDSLEELDEYCGSVGEQLSAIVVFTYCIYRTSEEYAEDFDNEEWKNILYKVNTDVETS